MRPPGSATASAGRPSPAPGASPPSKSLSTMRFESRRCIRDRTRQTRPVAFYAAQCGWSQSPIGMSLGACRLGRETNQSNEECPRGELLNGIKCMRDCMLKHEIALEFPKREHATLESSPHDAAPRREGQPGTCRLDQPRRGSCGRWGGACERENASRLARGRGSRLSRGRVALVGRRSRPVVRTPEHNGAFRRSLLPGRYEQAVPLAEKAVRLAERELGPDNPLTATR